MSKPSAEMTALEKLTRAIVGIPKKEIDEKARQYAERKKRRVAKRRST